MKIYTPDGWLNWDYLYNENKFIMAVTGARGTGKTYGLFKYVLEHKIKFIYLRRLKAQLDSCTNVSSNPFKKINSDFGYGITPQKRGGIVRFLEYAPSAEEEPPDVVGYGAALSTVATIRGIDYSDVECIIFDEFIAMSQERPIQNEVAAFNNFLETVNRNRELEGNTPIKVFMLGNANRLMNPYFLEWRFMRTALKMIHGGQMMYSTKNGLRKMVMLLNSPISERKKETALYQTASNDFIEMAIDNAFKTDETQIAPKQLKDCRHIVSIGTIGIYQLKSNGYHYVSDTINKVNYYTENDINLVMFRARYSGLKNLYLYGFIIFENFDCELLFRGYLGLD